MIINGEKIRLGDQMCFRFYTLSRLVIQTYEPYFKKIGITYTQYLVLIVLWAIASTHDLAYLPMVACFVMFLANDIYGFINWRRMRRRQQGG